MARLLAAALLAIPPASARAGSRTSANYRSPVESMNAGGRASSSASYSGFGVLGELAGDQLAGSYAVRSGSGRLFFDAAPGVPVITVTSLEDSGAGTLRQAIVDANLRPGPDAITIVLPAGTTGVIELRGILPDITGPLEIVGPGADRLTMQPLGFGDFHAFGVEATASNFAVSGIRFSSFFSQRGAIESTHAALALAGCFFDGNASPGVSAVRAVGNSRVAISGCVFSNNVGTAVHLDGVESFAIRGGSFVRNVGDADSGALRISASPSGTAAGTVDQVVFEANTAASGGAISLGGAAPSVVEVSASTFRDNTATGRGGALRNRGGILRLVQCTLSGNSAGEAGGGVDNEPTGTVPALTALRNCTLTENAVLAILGGADGGGIATTSTAGSRVTLRNTLVAGNLDLDPVRPSPDVFGSVVSEGHNLVGVADGVTGLISSDLSGLAAAPLDPGLDALADNGGPTLTHLPLPGSPALDNGDTTGMLLLIDQRGRPRTVDLSDVENGRGSDGSDIGAVEAEAQGGTMTPPEIVVQPRDVLVVRDGSGPVPAVLRVQAADADTYEWYVVRGGLTNRVVGASGDTLRFGDVRRADTGLYFVVMSNAAGRRASDGARLRLLVSQRLVQPEWTPTGLLRLRFTDTDGAVVGETAGFEVQVAAALEGAATVWRPVSAAVVADRDGLRADIPVVPRGAAAFYRVVER